MIVPRCKGITVPLHPRTVTDGWLVAQTAQSTIRFDTKKNTSNTIDDVSKYICSRVISMPGDRAAAPDRAVIDLCGASPGGRQERIITH